MGLVFEIYNYEEEDGVWTDFGGNPTLITFDFDNLEKNKGNILLFLEYHKFHLHGVSHIIDGSNIVVSGRGCHNQGICGAYLYSYLLLSDLQDYVLKDKYQAMSIENEGKIRYYVEIPDITDTDAWYQLNTDKYDAFCSDLKEKGITIWDWINLNKYAWYLKKIGLHKLPEEPFKEALELLKDNILKFYSNKNENKESDKPFYF